MKELAAQCSRGGDRNGNRNSDGDAGKDQNFPLDQPDYRPPLRSQRHANADFTSALSSRIGEDSIQSKSCKQRGQDAEHRGKQGDGTFIGEGVVDLGAQSSEVMYDELVVYVGDGGPDAGCSRILWLP